MQRVDSTGGLKRRVLVLRRGEAEPHLYQEKYTSYRQMANLLFKIWVKPERHLPFGFECFWGVILSVLSCSAYYLSAFSLCIAYTDERMSRSCYRNTPRKGGIGINPWG